jgi:hypothetical protein
MKRLAWILLALVVSLPTGSAAARQGACQPSWQPTFGGFPGTDVRISAFAVFDDGSGPALFAGGGFFTAGGVQVRHIAKWNGTTWSPVGNIGTGYAAGVHCLEVFDDGTGPALYAGGDFSDIGGVTAFGIAKWDGTSWSPLGAGVGGDVDSLEVFDDGTGPALYVGGDFMVAGGLSTGHVAKWDGTEWSALASPLPAIGFPSVFDMEVFDDGSGPALYVGGNFVASGSSPKLIARWDGTEWSSLGSGMLGLAGGTVFALQVFDEGNGPVLFAGGSFTSAGGKAADFVARWDGTQWSALGWPGGGTNGTVLELGVLDRGAGPVLVVAGSFSTAGVVAANQVATWNGSNWSKLAEGIALGTQTGVQTVATYDDGSGPGLYAGGSFQTAGTAQARNIARWDGAAWSPIGKGPDNPVGALTTFDDGTGPALYAGGAFARVGGSAAARIARWDGSSWSPLGEGMDLPVRAFAEFDGGSGTALVAGGDFLTAGGVDAGRIAAWDGSSWSPLGQGNELNAAVRALAVFDGGTGPALFAAGNFTAQGPISSDSIARWSGSSWSGVGAGLQGGASYYDQVSSLAVFDDGNGPALYAGGAFLMAGGEPADRIARWDGSSWTGVGGGTDHNVQALAVFDDGSGPALYVGGFFSFAGGVAADRIARWDGTSWSSLGAGLKGFAGGVHALAVFDDGSGAGPALYAGGSFYGPPLVPRSVARWDGSAWTQLGAQGSNMNTLVNALGVFDDGGGPALYAGGAFTTSAANDSYLAKWGCPTSPFTTFCTAKTTLFCGAAHINATGASSATASSGFVVEASPVRGCRPGLLLYSNQPTQAGVSFGGPGEGLLCLSGMGLRRAGPIQSNSAQQQCDGTFAIDMNEFRAFNWTPSGCNPVAGQSNPAGFLSSIGTTVNAQMWGRDSIATGQVLSDGIGWVIGP